MQNYQQQKSALPHNVIWCYFLCTIQTFYGCFTCPDLHDIMALQLMKGDFVSGNMCLSTGSALFPVSTLNVHFVVQYRKCVRPTFFVPGNENTSIEQLGWSC